MLLLPALLTTACGDDLADRNAALDHDQLRGGEERTITLERSAPVDAVDQGPEEKFATEDPDPPIVEVDGDALVADTRGFSADPMDDAGGLAPEPIAPERYVPETFQPERFDD